MGGFEGVNVVGREGSFGYNGDDHAIEMGLILAQKLLGIRSGQRT